LAQVCGRLLCGRCWYQLGQQSKQIFIGEDKFGFRMEVIGHPAGSGALQPVVEVAGILAHLPGRPRGQPADGGRVTLIDGILATAVLLGLILNAALGWWWADPAAGYVLVLHAVREVREIFFAGH
jgi:hypothetical protein